MLSSFSQFSGKLSIKLTLEYHIIRLWPNSDNWAFTCEHPRAPPARLHLHLSDYDGQRAQMTPHWDRRQICWRKEPPPRQTLAVWKASKPTSPAWSLTKINAKCCTWDAAIPASAFGTAWVVLMGGKPGRVSAGCPSSREGKLCHICINKRTIS